jgi:ATP-binding cassette subfamily B protein
LIFGLFLTALGWSVLGTLGPYAIKMLIDNASNWGATSNPQISALLWPAALYVFVNVLIGANFRINDALRRALFPRLHASVTDTMFAYLKHHSHRFFQDHFAGSLSNKISNMADGIVTVSRIADEASTQFFSMVVAAGAMVFVHPFFGAVITVWAAIFMLVSYYYSKKAEEISSHYSELRSAVSGLLVDSIGNMLTARAFARRDFEQSLIGNKMESVVSRDRELQWYILQLRIWQDVSIVALVAFMLGGLIYFYVNHQVTLGDFAFIITLTVSIFQFLWYMASQMVSFSQEMGKCAQALSIIVVPHEVTEAPDAKPLMITRGEIDFDQVSFSYHHTANVFDRISVTLEAAKKYGLVGFSGSGKTTFANLIMRFYDIDSGAILIDGQDIKSVTLDSLYEQIAMIPQETQLFHRTLMENIRYGRVEATNEEVMMASKMACCHEFIEKLPLGYDTLVGERGIKLSGGQRQRIAIARAFLKNAPILIMDEATSALDSVTEEFIQNELYSHMAGKTTLVIAHRLSTLSKMDTILVFDQGHIIEQGTHDELLNLGGHYARLWAMQSGGFLPEHLND